METKTSARKSAKNFDTISVSGGMRGLQVILSPTELAKFTDSDFADLVMEG